MAGRLQVRLEELSLPLGGGVVADCKPEPHRAIHCQQLSAANSLSAKEALAGLASTLPSKPCLLWRACHLFITIHQKLRHRHIQAHADDHSILLLLQIRQPTSRRSERGIPAIAHDHGPRHFPHLLLAVQGLDQSQSKLKGSAGSPAHMDSDS